MKYNMPMDTVYFNLGNISVCIVNYCNRYFEMQDVEFVFPTDGCFYIKFGKTLRYKSLEELKNTINKYKIMYKKCCAFSKALSADEDFY